MGFDLNDLAWRLFSGKVAYFIDFFIVPPIIAALLVWNSLVFGRDHAGQILIAFAGGLLLWTFVEYFIHRLLFHHVWPLKQMHDLHHENPEALYGAPPFLGPVLIFALVDAPLEYLDQGWAAAATAGVMAGYFLYISHHYLDHAKPRFMARVLARSRRRHMLHHHADKDTNFGVSTSLWDHVFRTEFKGRH